MQRPRLLHVSLFLALCSIASSGTALNAVLRLSASPFHEVATRTQRSAAVADAGTGSGGALSESNALLGTLRPLK